MELLGKAWKIIESIKTLSLATSDCPLSHKNVALRFFLYNEIHAVVHFQGVLL